MPDMNIRNVSEGQMTYYKSTAAAAGMTLRDWVLMKLDEEEGRPVTHVTRHDQGEESDVTSEEDGVYEVYQPETEPEQQSNWIQMPRERKGILMCREHRDRYCPSCEQD
jgi:hypothetical protein